jgi:hypothetical protein
MWLRLKAAAEHPTRIVLLLSHRDGLSKRWPATIVFPLPVRVLDHARLVSAKARPRSIGGMNQRIYKGLREIPILRSHNPIAKNVALRISFGTFAPRLLYHTI